MRKRVLLLGAALCTALLLCACSARNNGAAREAVLAELRQSYRGADLLICAACIGTETNELGEPLSVLRVENVVAGSAQKGDVLRCLSGDMQPGGDYFVYLTQETGDDTAYIPVNVGVLDGENVAFSKVKLPLAQIRADVETLNAVVSVPADVWFYQTLSALYAAADEIFVGRAASVPALAETEFRGKTATATVEHALPAAIARVEVLGSIKGSCRYGDVISMVHAPGLAADLVDAATLTAVHYGEADVPEFETGRYYIFFLLHGPDAKQDYYFGVNPVQGFVRLDEDAISVRASNEAVAGCDTLPALLDAIKAVAS